MGKIVGAAILPHPPIIVPEIGKDDAKKAQATIDGMKSVSRRLADAKADTVIVITPHGFVFRDAIAVTVEKNVCGNFSHFARPELSYCFDNDMDLVDELFRQNEDVSGPFIRLDEKMANAYGKSTSLDWGVLVPMYFLANACPNLCVLPIAYGILPPTQLAQAGKRLRQAIEMTNRRVAIVASGDLSHCLKDDGPYSFNEMGPIFDKKIKQVVEDGDLEGIINFDSSISEPAGECGLKSFQIMAGSLWDLPFESTVYSYQAPFGVGYMTAWMEPGKDVLPDLPPEPVTAERKEPEREIDLRRAILALLKARVNNLVSVKKLKKLNELRQDILQAGVLTEEEWQAMSDLRAGCFVTLYKHGNLRGCIGTIEPTQASLAEEIYHNAGAAAMRDPRFSPVQLYELKAITLSVDVLSEPEAIASPAELDIKRYGVIVEAGHKRGLLLPDLEGIDTVDQQVDIARRKAGIQDGSPYQLYRFEVIRYE